jgi:HK97 family phage portal protein
MGKYKLISTRAKLKEKATGISSIGPIRRQPDSIFLTGSDTGLGYGADVPQPYSNHAWVYACVRAISQNIAGVPLRIMSGTEKNRTDVSLSDPDAGDLTKVFKTPNESMTGFQLWECTTALLNLDGTAFWVLERGGFEEVPTEIYVYRKQYFGAIVNDQDRIVGWVYQTPGGEPIVLQPYQVLIFKFFNPYDPIFGLAPIEAARRGIRSDIAAANYSEGFFSNNADPSGVITSEKRLTPKQAKEILDLWESRHRGPWNSKRTGILHGGLDWKTISISQKDMEFIEQRKWTRDEVLAVFKVPKSEISLYEDINFASASSQNRGFWEKTIIPILKNYEAVLEAHFIPGLEGIVADNLSITFDLAQVTALQPNLNEQIANAEKLARIGYPVNDINDKLKLGMPRVSWGDTWYVNSAIVPIDMVLSGEVSGAKPSHPSVPGSDGKPPELDDDGNPIEPKDPPSPDDADSTIEETGSNFVAKTKRRIPSNQLFPVSFDNLKKQVLDPATCKLKNNLHGYVRRLRVHQLSKVLAKDGSIPLEIAFDIKEWNIRLQSRIIPVCNETAKNICKFLNKKEIRVNTLPLNSFNKLIYDKIVKDIETCMLNKFSCYLTMDTLRILFNECATNSQLLQISALEVARILKQIEGS